MTKEIELTINKKLDNKAELFKKNIKSKMKYRSEMDSIINNLEWLEKMEYAIPFIDGIVRNPKVTLISESEVEKIEKAKKIGVESIKDLAKHTNYIESMDGNNIKPSKILVLYREETYNLYENRIIRTLIDDISLYLSIKEEELNNLITKKDKEIQYISKTNNGEEEIEIDLRISAGEYNKNKDKARKNLLKKINEVKKRIKKLKTLVAIWKKSALITSLVKINAPQVMPPISKTNLILKNTNYKIATNLFLYLKAKLEEENKKAQNYMTDGNTTLLNLMNDAFLENYFVMDSISDSTKKQREQIIDYSLILLKHQLKRIVSILLKNGIKITEEELLKLINIEMEDTNSKTDVDRAVKKKFIKEIDDYLSKIQKGL